MAEKPMRPLQLIRQVWGNKNYSLAEKAVLDNLIQHAPNTTRICYPGKKTLAELTSMEEKTVGKALKSLEEKGAILKVGKHGGGRNDVYKIILDLPREALPVAEEKKTGKERYKELVAARGRKR